MPDILYIIILFACYLVLVFKKKKTMPCRVSVLIFTILFMAYGYYVTLFSISVSPYFIALYDGNQTLRGSFIIAFVAIISGLYISISPIIKRFVMDPIFEPRIQLELDLKDARDCHETVEYNKQYRVKNDTSDNVAFQTEDCRVFYIRIKVKNTGLTVAENVTVHLKSVYQQLDGNNGNYKEMKSFLRIPLMWSHYGLELNNAGSPQPIKAPELMIPVQNYRHLDFLNVFKPSNCSANDVYRYTDSLTFCLMTMPNYGDVSLMPGKYKVVLSVCCKNVRETDYEFLIDWEGQWELGKDINNILKIES